MTRDLASHGFPNDFLYKLLTQNPCSRQRTISKQFLNLYFQKGFFVFLKSFPYWIGKWFSFMFFWLMFSLISTVLSQKFSKEHLIFLYNLPLFAVMWELTSYFKSCGMSQTLYVIYFFTFEKFLIRRENWRMKKSKMVTPTVDWAQKA